MLEALVFYNAQLYTGGREQILIPDMAFVVKNGIIDDVGGSHAILSRMTGSSIHSHDMKCQIIAPGFFDGHMHLLLHGASLLKINLEPCKNIEDIRATIKHGAAQRPDAARIFCRGYMHSMLPGEPTAAMLDDLDPRPIFVNSRDLHSTWCNTAALQELGVQDAPNPAGGVIHRDAEGSPTGLLSEAAAINLVWPYENKVTSYEEKLDQARAAIKSYSAHGYTSLIEMATDEDIWACMLQLHKEGAHMRMASHWLIAPSTELADCLEQVDRAIELHNQYNLDNSPDCRIAGIKLILDGTIDACTAAVAKPYSSGGAPADPAWTAEHLAAVVSRADKAGLQCALHAIGDFAVKLAIDTLESCATPGRRHRIEHLELTSPADALRLGTLGITASIQPAHADPAILRAWPKLLGADRCKRAFAYKDFHDSGALLSIGTDAPTAPTQPLRNLYVATTRKSAREPESKTLRAVNPQSALPLPVALAAAAEGTAKSCFAESRVGTIEKGKLADFVALDMAWDGDQLLHGRVKGTWFGGEPSFKDLSP